MPYRIPEYEQTMKTFQPVLFILLVACALAACSSRQVYNAGVGWRQNECQKILEGPERARCMESANADYDKYEKEKAAAGVK